MRLVCLLEAPVGILADNAGGAFDATGQRFAFASGHEACLFDLARSAVIQRWSLADGFSDQLQFDPSGRLLLLRRERAGQRPGWIWRLHELAKSEGPVLLHDQTDTNWSALDMTFLSRGRKFLVWNGRPQDKRQTLKAFEVASGREVWHATNDTVDFNGKVCVDPIQERFGYLSAQSRRLTLVNVSAFEAMGRKEEDCVAIGISGERLLLSQWLVSGRSGKVFGPLKTQLGSSGDFGTHQSRAACNTLYGRHYPNHIVPGKTGLGQHARPVGSLRLASMLSRPSPCTQERNRNRNEKTGRLHSVEARASHAEPYRIGTRHGDR